MVFGRYRVFVDAWPIVTTLLLLSGALGIEAHFFMLGVNASDVLTLEEFTIYGVLGLLIALAVAMIGVAYFGSLLLCRNPRMIARIRRASGSRHWAAGYAYAGRRPFLISTVFIAGGTVCLWLSFPFRHLDLFRSPLWTGFVIISVAGLTFLYVMTAKPAQARIGLFLAACFFFIAPGVGVFLVLETRSPVVTVSLPAGGPICDPSAELLWKGRRTLVLKCDGKIVLVEEPQNVVIRTVS